MLQDFIHTPALREAMTSKDHKAWYLPMVLSGGVGTPELHEGFGRVSDIVKKSVAGTTLTSNLTGPAASGDDLMYIGIRDMHVIEARRRDHGADHLVRHLSKSVHDDVAVDHDRRIGRCGAVHRGGHRRTRFGRFQPDDYLDDDDDGRGRDRLRRVSHQPISRLSAARDAVGSSRRHGVDVDRQGDRRVRGNGVDHLSRDGLHSLGGLQKRRSGVGLFHCGGIAGRFDIPAGPDGLGRKARLDQATPRAHHAGSGGARVSALCDDPQVI